MAGAMTAVVVAVMGTSVPHEVVDVALVAAVAGMLIVACVQFRRRGHAERAARREIDRRSGLATALTRLSSLDPDELMDRIVDAVVDLGFEFSTIGVIRDGMMVPERHRGFARGHAPYAIRADLGLAGRAVATRRVVAVGDYLEFEDRLPDREGVRSAIALPLLVDGEVVGSLIAARSVAGEPRPAEVEVLEVLALHASHALGNARRFVAQREQVVRLTELDERRADFISNVSHELRTPVTVIQGLGQTLALRDGSLTPDARRDLLSRLMANSERLAVMVTTLLDLARLESGAAQVEPTAVQMRPTVAAAVRRLEPLAAGHDLSTDVADVSAIVDAVLFDHLLENLLVNAFRHTPTGTGIRVTVVAEGELARVAVGDDGPGIGAADVARLSERFYRGGDRGGLSTDGVGLGLALCQQILAAHGSRLEVTSELGRGTEFSFVLPLARPVPVPSASSARSPR